MDMKINKKVFTDADICLDLLFSQGQVTQHYVTLSQSCASKGLHEDVLSLISEEAKIHGDVYLEMLKRGFLQPQNATTKLVDEIKKNVARKK